MKILFAVSEAAPLVKTGGLGDVAFALPPALAKRGLDVRLIIPGYPEALRGEINASWKLDSLPGYPPARLLEAIWPNGLTAFVVDCPKLYERDGGPYQDAHGHDWPDNARRFALFCHAAVELAKNSLPWRPDIIHCNDWPTGLVPAYARLRPNMAVATVMTVHNLAYQGVFPAPAFGDLHLPAHAFDVNGLEFYGKLSFLKAGVYYADRLTTVSPSYAKEIQTVENGWGLHGLLRARANELTGILNGIDTRAWNPLRDPFIHRRYSPARLEGKAACKAALQKECGLEPAADVPLFGVVSRFTDQKGLDLVFEIAGAMTEFPGQLALLGEGDPYLIRAFNDLAKTHPGKISMTAGFDETAAHRIIAGADMFLMPSRFEPCGLSQMYSQRYGTVPIVRAAGGLLDTVEDFSQDPETATGFIFYQPSATDLFSTAQKAVQAFRDKPVWQRLQQNGMRKDFGWEKSARAYQAIYSKLVSKPNAAKQA
ncbi:MAG: glycogen synthase GlgA [Burkholderiales bacterium]